MDIGEFDDDLKSSIGELFGESVWFCAFDGLTVCSRLRHGERHSLHVPSTKVVFGGLDGIRGDPGLESQNEL